MANRKPALNLVVLPFRWRNIQPAMTIPAIGFGISLQASCTQNIGRVLLNILNNAFYAVEDRKKQKGQPYEPGVFVSTKNAGSSVEIRILDNGSGIPHKLVDKIFQPFFTTKPTG